ARRASPSRSIPSARPSGSKPAPYASSGVEVAQTDSLPMKLAVFDGARGLLALLDPVITRPTWTAIVFEHAGMGEAMKGLFENYWRRRLSRTVLEFAPAQVVVEG
ncbi:MAG: hypothetical protein ACLPWF_25890, partial [Bryobacteraceae bacterium]